MSGGANSTSNGPALNPPMMVRPSDPRRPPILRAVAFSHDARVITATFDQMLRPWDAGLLSEV